MFTGKNDLPILSDYRRPAPDSFWEKFPSHYAVKGKSWIDPVKLESLARAYNVKDMDRVLVVCNDLLHGANIGCEGVYRTPTVSSNAPSAFDFPAEITDAIACWLKKGLAIGPFSPTNRPANAKINGIMCRPKPNGSARVILNLSAPAGLSVNDGIDANLFPAVMSSTYKWLEILNKAGRGALIAKIDWQDAYKHFAVRQQDLPLQWFNWLGMDFAELSLIFGGASSCGIFDRGAKVVKDIVTLAAEFPEDMLLQHLDDLCGACPAGSAQLHKFVTVYRQIAAAIGVRLASTDDPDKAFDPCTAGTVLGVKYDTERWSWEIPEEKLNRLLHQLQAGAAASVLPQHELWSLIGRLLHYAPLIPESRFFIRHILKLNNVSEDRNHLVAIPPAARRQMNCWSLLLRATNGYCAIPRVPENFPPWTWEFYTDAAGGCATGGRGAGGVATGFWFFLPWSRAVNCGARAADGKLLARKLSVLELVGPLVCVSAAFERIRGYPARAWVDNAGSVRIWQKGYSNSCQLCSTLVQAIAVVSAAAGCRFSIEKIRRCSVPGAIIADALSQANFAAVWEAADAWEFPVEPAHIPLPILQWVQDPQPDDLLGGKILRTLAESTGVLGL